MSARCSGRYNNRPKQRACRILPCLWASITRVRSSRFASWTRRVGNWATALLIPHQHLEPQVIAHRVIEQSHEFSRENVALVVGWSAGDRIAYRDPQQIFGGLATRPLAPGTVIAYDDVKLPAGGNPQIEPVIGGVAASHAGQPIARWVQLIPSGSACGFLGSGAATRPVALGDCSPKLLVRVIFAGDRDCKDVAFRPGIHIPLTMEARSNPDTDAFPITLSSKPSS